MPMMRVFYRYPERECPGCGEMFEPKRKGARACSHQCSSMVLMREKRGTNPEQYRGVYKERVRQPITRSVPPPPGLVCGESGNVGNGWKSGSVT